MSQPWHGLYWIIDVNKPDVTVSKVYFPQDRQIQVHLLRITLCPPEFPAGYYWYGRKKCTPSSPVRWIQELLFAAQMSQQDQDVDKGASKEMQEKVDMSEVDNESGDDNESQEALIEKT